MKKVYVVSWEYDGGGGFEWYTNKKHALNAYKKEKENEESEELSRENWKARYNVFQVKGESAEQITNELQYRLA